MVAFFKIDFSTSMDIANRLRELDLFRCLLVQSSHFNMDFLMCALTVLSMCMILFVLSDLDQFHTGGITIDVSGIDFCFKSEAQVSQSCRSAPENLLRAYPEFH